jgi:glycosyltransferase involved in cell wall biosynthesis
MPPEPECIAPCIRLFVRERSARVTSPKKSGILFVSTADWNNPYWTNKQHVALQLAARGHRILYVESQGLRSPTLTGKDFRRMLGRLKRGLRRPQYVRENLWVWSPLVIPLQKYALVRWLNQIILRLGVLIWSSIYGIRTEILWTYSPLTTKLYDLRRYRLTVYHAVDDISAQPGMPAHVIKEGESDLVAKSNIIFTTSPNIQESLAPLNPETYFFSNVADFSHFNRALNDSTIVPDDIASIPGPRVGFVGAISSYKLDFGLIQSMANLRPDWSFVFVGEIGEGDPLTDASSIKNIENIYFLGGRPYNSLPGYMKGIDVAILPNNLNEYTKSMFPMKFFEYLAAGRPVVSTPLHALRGFDQVVEFADDAADFCKSIENMLNGEGPSLQSRLEVAREQTYEVRTEKMMTILENHINN